MMSWVGCSGRGAPPAKAEPSASASGFAAPSASTRSAEPTPTAGGTASASAEPTAAPLFPPTLSLPEDGPIRAFDLHVDTPWRVHFKGRAKSANEGPATPEKLRAGHYAALVYPIYLPDYIHDDHPTIADADAVFATIEAIVAEQELLVPAAGEIPADRVAVFVSIEGAGAFADDITQIDRFVKRGVTLIGPVHARDNRLAGAATGKSHGGLTELGKQFCERVYAAGGLVDVSHLSDAGFEDLKPIAKKFGAPIVATHSNARAKQKHRRNLTDEQLRAIGETGGVVGLNLHRGFLGSGKLKTVVQMVQHLVKVAGIDHVALGTDFEGGTATGAIEDASKLPQLAEALQKAGLSEADLRAIYARNALRVLAWQPAK
jgi:membrane dipeptidase